WEEKRDGTTGRAVTWHISPSDYAPLAQETDEGLYPILADQVGMPKAVFTQAGERVWSAAASVWGKILPAKGAANEATGTGAAFDTSLRFAGQWEDEESGLHYNLNRYYDAESGQYLSVDPIGLAGGLRTHGYVAVPSAAFDPLGLASCSFLYRGVSAKHPAIEEAKRGIVRPANPSAQMTPEEHAEGGGTGESQYVSWTKSKDLALDHANKDGPGGVLLSVPVGAPGPGDAWRWGLDPH
ncbi:MAG: RHS repeat-associated core domain-containing protein, partial [Trinickia sp.]|uniref:RHS repeat-associated core domain-containing protein n=1 Tax=Trinickia sp. TaxID=2571163 RepID=UPI003F81A86A